MGLMSIELRFESELAAPLVLVWERVVAVSGANDELWPLAKMTFPVRLDSHTPPEDVVGRRFATWTPAFGLVPVDRRTLQVEVFEKGRFRECSMSWLQGQTRHERTAAAGTTARPCSPTSWCSSPAAGSGTR